MAASIFNVNLTTLKDGDQRPKWRYRGKENNVAGYSHTSSEASAWLGALAKCLYVKERRMGNKQEES